MRKKVSQYQVLDIGKLSLGLYCVNDGPWSVEALPKKID